jgi:thiol peroxidase
MAEVTLGGNVLHTIGEMPAVGATAPPFTLTDTEFKDRTLEEFAGKTVVLNVFLSIDTRVCPASVRRFNEEASTRPGTVVLCISADLPYAYRRFCGAEGITNVICLSDFRHKEFAARYGVLAADGPIAGLMVRAVIVIDAKGKVMHTELVPNIGQEPDYAAALAHCT